MKKYEKPKIEIILFETEDFITTSFEKEEDELVEPQSYDPNLPMV